MTAAQVATQRLQSSRLTTKAFQGEYADPHTESTIDDEIVYVCNKGSDWAQSGKFLVLRSNEPGWWTASDRVVMDGTTLRCRQAVFRSSEDITAPGWPTWNTGFNAAKKRRWPYG